MKEKNKKTFEEVASGAADCLRNKLLRTAGTIHCYHCLWRRVKEYMESSKIKFFDSAVGRKYLLQEFGERDYSQLLKREKYLIKSVEVLCEVEKTGSIEPVKEQTVFEGTVGQLMTRYLSHRVSMRLKKHTIDEGAQHLHRFLC